MNRRKFTPRKNIGSGGIRVDPGTLVEVLCEATVFWGIHNFTQHIAKVKKGYRFYAFSGVGDWHDVVPVFHRPSGKYFKYVAGPHKLSGDQLHKRNVDRGFLVYEEFKK